MPTMTYTFEPIAHIRSCFKEKFGIPRQPGLVPEARAFVAIEPAFQRIEAFQALDGFSHIWIVFVFHQCRARSWSPTVRPPRLGGNRKVGVFASRSGFRPNPIGQSVVNLVSFEAARDAFGLHVSGIDLLDGTPVLDIKPYLPYADSIRHARAGYADPLPKATCEVAFSPAATEALVQFENAMRPDLKRLIVRLLAFDPRPAYIGTNQRRTHGMRLWDLNVKFDVRDNQIIVTKIHQVDGT
jgi:tRNA-Thr(GGU) m(6)t(6)A37 methyltransferase TsaA